jgi:hypothetical protein
MKKKSPFGLDLILFSSPALITERKEEFDELHAALTEDLAPRDIVEKIFVDDIARIFWDLRRQRRAKTALLDMASKNAVLRILGNLRVDQCWAKQADDLWFTDAGFRQDLIELLGKFSLDESAIDAEAMRWVAQDVEVLDKQIASREMRFRNALRTMTDYRQSFADQARIASNRLIEAPRVIPLEEQRIKKAD